MHCKEFATRYETLSRLASVILQGETVAFLSFDIQDGYHFLHIVPEYQRYFGMNIHVLAKLVVDEGCSVNVHRSALPHNPRLLSMVWLVAPTLPRGFGCRGVRAWCTSGLPGGSVSLCSFWHYCGCLVVISCTGRRKHSFLVFWSRVCEARTIFGVAEGGKACAGLAEKFNQQARSCAYSYYTY